MSIKEDIDFVKEELTQDEKVLAGLIKAERFYKKNKFAVIAVVILLVVGGLGYELMGYFKLQRLQAANEAYLQLLKNPSDHAALTVLKDKNPALMDLYTLHKATQDGNIKALEKLSNSKDAVIADLSKYHAAVWKKNIADIKNYRMQSGALLRDFALFDEAYLLMKEGKVKEGKDRISLIESGSPLKGIAHMLNHYGIKGKE